MRAVRIAAAGLWVALSMFVSMSVAPGADPGEASCSADEADDERRTLRGELERKLAELERLRTDIADVRRRLGAPQQFQLNVQMLEIAHHKLTDTTRERLGLKSIEPTSGGIGGLILAAGEQTQHDAQRAPDGHGAGKRRLRDIIKALRSDGAGRVMAEPELIVTEGVPARMLSGGEFPVLIPGNDDASRRVEWREFGVQVEALAHVTGADRVRLDLTVEKSRRDFSHCVAIEGNRVPLLNTTRASSRVEVTLGEPLMIGGMWSSTQHDGLNETVETVIVVTIDEHTPRR
ncbi:MAG TPA: hypothetical protein VML55_21520 [Planctomycetaceae bacterium]|nr:hypothetical protein [Planctomycetaceae bacterium]